MCALIWEALNSTWMLLSQHRVSLSYCYQWKNTQQQTERNYFSKNLKTDKLILKSISRTGNLAHGSVHASKVRWVHGKNYSTQISNQGTQADLKMCETSKMKYLEIHKFPFKNIIFLTIEYKMCLKILQKLRCLVGFQNRQIAPIGRGKNLVNFELLNLVKKSLPLSTKRKLSILLNFLFPSASFRGVILAELSGARSVHHG